ncbi:hypothetical protein D9M68_497050 [compost metagenome]
MEKAIKANPYIAFAKVYADMDGVIRIEVKQRQPVLRIINAGGQDYYIDRTGLKMPVSSNFTANVLVATGNILEGFGGRVDTVISPLLKDLYKTAVFIKQDTLWDAQIEQLVVNGKNDIELIPRVGNQRIILGNADSLTIKMDNLLAFYKQAMPKVGWETYKTINVKYINQVICEKTGLDLTPVVNKLPDSLSIAKQQVDSAVNKAIKEEIKQEAAKVEAAPKAAAIAPLTTGKTTDPKKTANTENKAETVKKEKSLTEAKEKKNIKENTDKTGPNVKPVASTKEKQKNK